MSFVELLLTMLDSRLLLEKKAEYRIKILDGPDSPEKAEYKVCTCPACIIARQFLEHRRFVGAFTEAGWSPRCHCHHCCGHVDGDPGRSMPHEDCPCEYCVTARAGVVDMKEESAKEKAKNISFDAKADLLSVLAQRKQNLQLSAAAPVDDPRTESKQQLNDTREDSNMANDQTFVIRDRKKVDIAGKEPPVFETSGTKISYPEGMSPLEAAEWLLKREREMEMNVTVEETIDGFPLDAAIALSKALNRAFGWAETGGIPTWYGSAPPSTISVPVGVNKYENVPWGTIIMPGIEGEIWPCAGHPHKDGRPVLTIHGNVKKKHRQRVSDIIQDARDILRSESIYKGKAIKVTFPDIATDHEEDIKVRDMPTFYDTSKIDPSEVVFSKQVEDQINVSLFTPIRHTDECRKFQIPLKRITLFAGSYGVGKTLVSAVTAKEGPLHGWTFILINSAEDLHSAIEFAKAYEPAIIFAEDVDSVVKGERSVDMDAILNTIDGIESKGRELIIVLTTNHPEKINKAMLRPGRVDAYIEVTPPDAEAVQRLIRVYARELLPRDEDLTEVGHLLAGHKPSSIREVVEKAKLASIFNNNGAAEVIRAKDLALAATIMKPHFALMEERAAEEHESLDAYFRRLITETVATGRTNGSTATTREFTPARA